MEQTMDRDNAKKRKTGETSPEATPEATREATPEATLQADPETQSFETQESEGQAGGSIANSGEDSDKENCQFRHHDVTEEEEFPHFMTFLSGRKQTIYFKKGNVPKECPSGPGCDLSMMNGVFEDEKLNSIASDDVAMYCNGTVHRFTSRVYPLSAYRNGCGVVYEIQQYTTRTSVRPGISIYLSFVKEDGRYFSMTFPLSNLESLLECLHSIKEKNSKFLKN
jgi:hypothetical protein